MNTRKVKFYICSVGEKNIIRFIDENGNNADPIAVLMACTRYSFSLCTNDRVVPITTRMAAFGAIEDGVLTTVGREILGGLNWLEINVPDL